MDTLYNSEMYILENWNVRHHCNNTSVIKTDDDGLHSVT